jgi:hypothetical protein
VPLFVVKDELVTAGNPVAAMVLDEARNVIVEHGDALVSFVALALQRDTMGRRAVVPVPDAQLSADGDRAVVEATSPHVRPSASESRRPQ